MSPTFPPLKLGLSSSASDAPLSAISHSGCLPTSIFDDLLRDPCQGGSPPFSSSSLFPHSINVSVHFEPQRGCPECSAMRVVWFVLRCGVCWWERERGVVWCCVVLCGVVWCCVVLCGVVWCCVVWCCVVWCCVVLCCVVLCCVVLCCVVLCCVVLCCVVLCCVVLCCGVVMLCCDVM